MLRNALVAAVIAAGVAVAAPAAAHADYYISASKARSFTRSYANDRYGATGVVASCRPQGRNSPKNGFIYHRWLCGWAGNHGCSGRVLIIGSSTGRNDYYYRTSIGPRC